MIFKKTFILFFIIFSAVNAQQKGDQKKAEKKTKLVVGIVVDQMRYDYLTRFYNKYGTGGFKKIISNGFSCNNHHFDYIPTNTGPGHASIFTGTTPRYHGIIGNIWYDREKKEKIYCVSDSDVSPTGTSSPDGKMSPSLLKLTTIADQNRIHTQMKGKSISIGLKERGAILSGGHTANAAYWFRGKAQGNWISSSFYMDRLPKWVIDFNESELIDSYYKTWNTLYDINTYDESGPDFTNFERGFKGKEKAVFPYDLDKLKNLNGEYDIITRTPFGNSLTTNFAIKAIEEEKLGKDNHTDFLMISFSSTDYIGHNFGVNSKEIEDTYIRLDKDIELLIKKLDFFVGKEEYILFLTSDHGATHVPSYLKTKKIPSGYFKEATIHLELKNYIQKLYKRDSIIENISNHQVFLNYELINKLQLDSKKIQKEIADYLFQKKQINRVFTRSQIEASDFSSIIGSKIKKGFDPKRSGDVCYVLTPSTITYSKTGSAHSSGYIYDTHVPLLFYGSNIKKGITNKSTFVSDIAPTIAVLLGISFPNGTTGNVISEVTE
ncbi:alkaline phosphatase family protein [Aquimarina sp. AD1]|uniref:alkaline phosphatase PafA n=1 Tax=Aquimarina sp. (strain AD1) TaxID=1714848 RepID=UPI000E4D1625|nr:alkaline phosphatase PafA [Aquimarina sp. AD1]AXT57188.1 alkaline phosphatase family protein [Aquimarina sp. AD1]RKN35825.1 alkaline phosphatase family protein [Aquimarina sp. AD1]